MNMETLPATRDINCTTEVDALTLNFCKMSFPQLDRKFLNARKFLKLIP